jgi:hypothetical protein
VIFNKQFKNHPTLSQGLTGIARNIQFSNGKAYLITSTAISGGSTVLEPMMVVIDGAITSGDVDNVNPGEVASYENLRGATADIYGLGAGAGVIVYNTNHGGSTAEISKEMSPGLLSITPQGFYRAREFYSPVYDAAKKGTAEGRTTIFWKPNLITNDAGNAAVDYFMGPANIAL